MTVPGVGGIVGRASVDMNVGILVGTREGIEDGTPVGREVGTLVGDCCADATIAKVVRNTLEMNIIFLSF